MAEPSVEPPEAIRSLVTVGPEQIVFRSARRSWELMPFGLAAGLVPSVLIGGAMGALAFVVGWVSGEPGLLDAAQSVASTLGFFLVGLGVLGGILAGRAHRPIAIDPSGSAYLGFLAPAGPMRGAVRISGMPGKPMELRVNGQLLGRFVSNPASRNGWSFATVSWLAARIGALWGVGVHDDRSAGDWQRWESDPVYRAELAWDRKLQRNRSGYGSLHRSGAYPPSGHEASLTGVETRVSTGWFSSVEVVLRPGELTVGDRTVPLDRVTRAAVFFEAKSSSGRAGSGNKRYYARLKVLVDGREKTLLKRKISRHGGKNVSNLLWVAEQIRAGMGSEGRDEGSAAEIPQALRAMQAARPPEG